MLLAFCNFIFNPVINFILVFALRTNPELSKIILAIVIRAVSSLAFIVVDRILIVFTKITYPDLGEVSDYLLLF